MKMRKGAAVGGGVSGIIFLAIIIFILKTGVFYVAAVFIDNFGPRFRMTSSMRKISLGALAISFAALTLYVVGF